MRWRKAGRKRAASSGRVGRRIDEAGSEDALRVGRQLAAHGMAGGRSRDSVELVEEPWDGVALGVEVEGASRLVAQEQEADELRGQQVGHLVGGGAAAARGAHLAAADIEELVGHVQGRFALEDLARDGVTAVPAAALRGEVLAAAFDADRRSGSTWRPSRR